MLSHTIPCFTTHTYIFTGDVANDSCEFHVFSADNKVWCFEATSPEVHTLTLTHSHTFTPHTPSQEAASWVKAIGDQIKKTISESVSHKRVNSNTKIDKKEILLIDGNNFCTDCNSPSKLSDQPPHNCWHDCVLHVTLLC